MVRKSLVICIVLATVVIARPTAQQQRPMAFLDMQQMKNAGSPTPSPNGQWMLYTVSTPDWQAAERQSDIYLVSMTAGVSSTKQMTFTTSKNETSPAWLPDGSSFLFLSNREAPANGATQNQIFMMRVDGGEARKITDAKDGVVDFALSPDGRTIAYRAGRAETRQLFRMPVASLETAKPENLTKQPAGVDAWEWAPDNKRIYFVTADKFDDEEKARRDKRFTVNIRNAETPTSSLWALDLNDAGGRFPGEGAKTTPGVVRLSKEGEYSVAQFAVSGDGKWIGFRGGSPKRYERNITQEGLYSDLYLVEVASGQIERLTQNSEVGESAPQFSPDSRNIAYSAPDNMQRYSMTNNRVYLRAVADRGKTFKKLDGGFDGDLSIGFWSKDGKTIYFNEGIKATQQLFSIDCDQNEFRQITREPASISVDQDERTGKILINYADGSTPSTIFTVPSIDQIANKAAWIRLTDTNPQVRGFALGEQSEITWTSTDGTKVGGVLVKPVGYQAGRRYPLIVAIHGGPASADILSFNGGYGSQVYAGAGYMVLRPNYRGSTNYGFKHKTDIVGDYFKKGFEDIMTGVDYLIAQGMVDGNQMGALGWSAGGHWSNWILTHTDRFKAISSGAGTSNWISMYAQSDVQRNRQFYLGDKLPYDDHDAYWNQSPLKYIRNAKTPTMIHVVEGDPRVPSPQSIELHMALKQIGVPTELFMYPGNTHGIPDTRNQLVKSVSEMAWMDYYVRGKGEKFSWRQVLDTIK
ncbi:MAG TPA: prolyl oligopeptidase family serine peptidase [Vicinamibacterales bacterium]|nr:prolyl oligopeptidase family serine peptidase [Vicinamibacterales bacterium]